MRNAGTNKLKVIKFGWENIKLYNLIGKYRNCNGVNDI